MLKWRIYPDTPYFWLDLCIKLWDNFAIQTLPLEDRRLFKIKEGTEEHEQPLLSQQKYRFPGFLLSEPNRFRRVI